ncbi:MAG: peptidylprolyl isomerase [Anaerolineales bacterium]
MRISLWFAAALLWLAGCSLVQGTGLPTTESLPPVQQVTPTPPAMIAIVNGEGIPSDMYNASLGRFIAAQNQTGTLLATDDLQSTVLNDLIDRLLLAQGAREADFSLTDEALDERVAKVIEEAGGQEAFGRWMASQGYTMETFREELTLEIEAAWMREQIVSDVPTSAEQVLARQVLLNESFQAERLFEQLEGGTSFEQIVVNNDPQRLGTLGWFPRGTLLQKEVEDAAFALQPGEYSEVVETELGFHIIEVLDRDPDRPLNPQAILALRLKALEDWLEERRAQSTIEIFIQ